MKRSALPSLRRAVVAGANGLGGHSQSSTGGPLTADHHRHGIAVVSFDTDSAQHIAPSGFFACRVQHLIQLRVILDDY